MDEMLGKPMQVSKTSHATTVVKKGHMSYQCTKTAAATTDDKWKKIPPKKGEHPEKIVGGALSKWCGHCSEWQDHSTLVHGQQQAQANQAVAIPSDIPSNKGSISCLSMIGI